MPFLKKGAEPPKTGKGSFLTPKMERFVEEYMIDMNASEAVLRAGYKTRNQNRVGTTLLQHPLVKAEIEKRMQGRRDRMELTADYVLAKLVNIVEQTEAGNPQAALRGLELLGKHLGLYKDRQEISGPDGEAIRMEQKVKQDAADFTSRLGRLASERAAEKVVPLRKADDS